MQILNPSTLSALPCARPLRIARCKRGRLTARCSKDDKAGKGFGKDDKKVSRPNGNLDASNPADALARSLGEVSKLEGRVSNSNNMIFGDTNSEEKWREIDKKVNEYPCQRTFTAIGTGGSEFKASMVELVESFVGPVHMECVSSKNSGQGRYISVRIGPVWVESPDQVVKIYTAMNGDERLKWAM
ncbi:hypothetical protein BSKO_01572 [Bryopsis sp. KO-2023]|nr:hypothetical protein BSKO_01572 [Bryopsis sp. KO-2023]